MLFNEPKLLKYSKDRGRRDPTPLRFSALQRAEIAEIQTALDDPRWATIVSVLFNEPKLLKSGRRSPTPPALRGCFSALQRAEIAEIGCPRRML